MKKKSQAPSQLMELFLELAEELGFTSDREIGMLADVGAENVPNWRTGAVREFKTQKFLAAKRNLQAQVRMLRAQAGQRPDALDDGLNALEIEEGSSPTDLQRQFRDRVVYDYLGHRFLYFEPQGALAWENLIRAGYDQDRWLIGAETCATQWLETSRDGEGLARGPIARALGFNRRDRPRGVDVISLGPGEGGKELRFLRELLEVERNDRQRPAWLAFAPVDVSIPLLLTAAKSTRLLFARDEYGEGRAHRAVLPFSADFEEGQLAFVRRLRTATPGGSDGLRIVLVLGNVLGNLRDEETFVRNKLRHIMRPGDLVWLEVGLRLEHIESDPLFSMTDGDRKETATEANRRLLLEGPYRRWMAALGRKAPDLALRVWVREDDDSSRIPGSYNFCHDLLIKDERRVCTMLYSRRYDLERLTGWLESLDFEVMGIQRVRDSKGRARVAHLLLRAK